MKRESLSKVLSLITAVSLLFGMMVTAHAAEPTLTRGEMAALLVEGAGLSEQVASYQAKPSAFKDVAESSAYKGCINLAYEKGLVSGTGNGCFSPDAKTTQVEAAAVILRSAKVPGEVLKAWPASFHTAADSTGLLAGVDYNANGQVTEAAFRQMMSNAAAAMAGKPFIGISWKNDAQDYSSFHDIIALAGGVAVELPQISNLEDAKAAVNAVEGIIVTGGEDINPDLYGEKHDPLLEDNNAHRDVRDTSDYNLIKAAVDEDVPMLAICRGMQMLNVVCGGGIVQDLPTYLGTDDANYKVHRNRPDWARHDITVTDNSKWVAEIVGNDGMKDVASWHHQVVNPERVGKGLTVTSYGPDEVIEAVEYQSNEFALGIQFHPEADAKENLDFAAFFGTLVKYAGN